ncbi:unnamed protein product [Symbiodinium sp. CCMP2456]|nr:unnamed protein product [Symbiodinium sp. CCMP2456]
MGCGTSAGQSEVGAIAPEAPTSTGQRKDDNTPAEAPSTSTGQRKADTTSPSPATLDMVVGRLADDTVSKVAWPSLPPSWRSEPEGNTSSVPVVILDVGKGMAKVKASFFRLFPCGRFMTVAQFCDDTSLVGRCVLVIHGGTEHSKYIQEAEKHALTAHLESGGALLTIASGSTFCGCNKGCLGLLPYFAHDRRNWNRGTGQVTMLLSSFGQACLPSLQTLQEAEGIQSQYFNGPALVPMMGAEYQALGGPFDLECGMGVPFLTYQTEMNECQSKTSLLGMPAVIAGELKPFGGRFVAVSPNVEVGTSKSSYVLMEALVSWASIGIESSQLGDSRSQVTSIDAPVFDADALTGTLRDGGALIKLSPASSRLPAIRQLDQEGGFALPEGHRLVLVDLGKGPEQLQEIFGPLVPDAEQRPIVEPEALPSFLRRTDVVLLHGGMANEHAERLGVDGRRAIRRHLHEGGSVMGICAGAHWLSCRDLPLWGHVVPALPHDNANWRRGVGDVTVSLTGEGRRILGLADLSSLRLRYANGPLLVSWVPEAYNNYQPGRVPESAMHPMDDVLIPCASLPTPVAVFSDCQDDRIEGWPSMKGHAAAWAWQSPSSGRAVVLSPHPEYAQTEESRLLFRRLLLWCVG